MAELNYVDVYTQNSIGQNTANQEALFKSLFKSIEELNTKYYEKSEITNQELNQLRIPANSPYMQIPENYLRSKLDFFIILNIELQVKNLRDRYEAFKWAHLGLVTELAVRKACNYIEVSNSLETISIKLQYEIKRLNQKEYSNEGVSDKDLTDLSLSGNDIYSNMSNMQLKDGLDPFSIINIQCSLTNEEAQNEALRWIKRGLSPILAVRKVNLTLNTNIEDTQKTIGEVIIKKDINIKQIKSNPDKYLILDTETTGLSEYDEIVQFTLMDLYGNVVYSSYYYPYKEVNKKAQEINRLSKAKLKGSPLWKNEWKTIANLIKDKTLIIQNAEFDTRLIKQTCKRYKLNIDFNLNTLCTKSFLKATYGHMGLGKAAVASGFIPDPNKQHDATYDCEMLLWCLFKNERPIKQS